MCGRQKVESEMLTMNIGAAGRTQLNLDRLERNLLALHNVVGAVGPRVALRDRLGARQVGAEDARAHAHEDQPQRRQAGADHADMHLDGRPPGDDPLVPGRVEGAREVDERLQAEDRDDGDAKA